MSIPIHPQPGFYETIIAHRDEGDWDGIGHRDVERITARPRWSMPPYDVDKAWAKVCFRLTQSKTMGPKKRRPPKR